MNARIVIVDDHALVRMGLRDVLGDVPGFEVVGEGANADDGIHLAVELAPDIVLLDVNMPGGGVEAAAGIRDRAPGCKILMFSFLKDSRIVRACLAAGASGYIVKGASGEELAGAVNAILSGQTYIDPSLPDLSRTEDDGAAPAE
jgi:DNA-binding NarL/FixJ family response regulator